MLNSQLGQRKLMINYQSTRLIVTPVMLTEQDNMDSVEENIQAEVKIEMVIFIIT
jgi:hypothetical protein